MSLVDFKASPWRQSHPAYQRSAFVVSPAPEYANSEVLVAALFRAVGLGGLQERDVGQNGRELDRRIAQQSARDRRPTDAALEANDFQALVHEVLESPKRPNQSAKGFVQVSPLVGAAATFSGAARQQGNSWPAGDLVRRMVWLGNPNPGSAEADWKRLFQAASVGEGDDVFARFMQDELGAWGPRSEWVATTLDDGGLPRQWAPAELGDRPCPARRFASDLRAIAAAKDRMTRRQWVSLLEALLRIAAVSHVFWLCAVQARTWGALRQALAGEGPSDEDAARAHVYPRQLAFLSYGGAAIGRLNDSTSAFLHARLGINGVLWALEDAGLPYKGEISNAADIAMLCRHVRENRAKVLATGLNDALDELADREGHVLACKKGIGSNMMEFARHVLYQRPAANPILRGYDQGYVLRKQGPSRSSPWICSLGPVAVLALVHCSLHGLSGPRSVHRLAQHLGAYGIDVNYKAIAQHDLGQQLRMLGLVLDSPDAESGMLLVPPFAAMDH